MSRPFLVVFTARSGSTALFGNCRAHPDFVMRAEVFGNKMLPGDIEQNDDNRLAFLDQFWRAYKNGDTPADRKFRGFKFQVTRNGQQFSDPTRLVTAAKAFDPAIIVLRRENILKQAISALNAKRLKVASAKLNEGRESAHITANENTVLAEIRKSKLTVDVEDLDRMITGIKANYSKLNQIAEQFGSSLNITYEQYLDDRDTTVKAVFEYIGADPGKWQPADAYQKITSDNLKDVIQNYASLENFACSNGLEAML